LSVSLALSVIRALFSLPSSRRPSFSAACECRDKFETELCMNCRRRRAKDITSGKITDVFSRQPPTCHTNMKLSCVLTVAHSILITHAYILATATKPLHIKKFAYFILCSNWLQYSLLFQRFFLQPIDSKPVDDIRFVIYTFTCHLPMCLVYWTRSHKVALFSADCRHADVLHPRRCQQ
jgi:hypothetical protein